MNTSRLEKAAYTVSSSKVVVDMEAMDDYYASVGDPDLETYDVLEGIKKNGKNPGELPDKGKDEVVDKGTAKFKANRSHKKRNFILFGGMSAMNILLLIAVAVLVFLYVSSNSKGQGDWAEWLEWTQCSRSCGIGMQSRTRSCINQSPDTCFGNSDEVRLCYPETCAGQGKWDNWLEWTRCSKSCDTGMQSRTRSCSNQSQDLLESNCFGNSDEVRLCYPGSCADGGWSDWQSWSTCSVECGGGFRTRSRTCSDPLPSASGRYCHGNPFEISSCGNKLCWSTDCYDLIHNDWLTSDGVYEVVTWHTLQRIEVYCDMTTEGGGWTVFQYRFNGEVDFYRNFSEYETGFGNVKTEFWLGLRYIQEIASQGQTDLRIDLEAANGTKAFEVFDKFYLSPSPDYTLNLGQTTDSLRISSEYRFRASHNGKSFSTYDRDVDSADKHNCAEFYHGAWWYRNCYNANLNGLYMDPGTVNNSAIVYYSFLPGTALKSSKMMMRRKTREYI